MPDSDAFDELMDRWEEQFERGNELSPEDLCRDRPEFLDSARKHIRALKAVGSGAAEAPAPAREEPVATDRRPAIPGYEILDELGRGGMGVVYRARQTALKRLVALKMILRDDLAGDVDRARFRAEAEALGQLQHPNIVQVYDVGENAGRPYFALELVPGGSLAGRLTGEPFEPRAAAGLMRTLATAVQFAHERGFIHRDLKPGNILLGPAGEPKITDFGLAKRWSADGPPAGTSADAPVQTASGEILGTPAYMAPEQALGDARAAGPGADIYALGAILYQLLTGQLPFRAASLLEVLEQVARSVPTPPRRVRRTVSRDLETICLKCLEKNPARRYLTAGLLADDLQRYLDGRPILARPITLPVRFGRWCRRNPLLAATSGAAALALVATAVVSVAFAVESERGRKDLQTSRDRLRDALATSETHRKESVRHLAESFLDRGLALCEQGEVAQGMWWLVRGLERADEFPDLARVIEANLTGWDGQVCALERVIEHPDRVNAAAVGADDLFAAAIQGEPGIHVWSLKTGERVPLNFGGNDRTATALAFHPTEPVLTSGGSDGRLHVWRVRDGATLLGTYPARGPVTRARYSDTGRWLGVQTGSTFQVCDAADGFRPTKAADQFPGGTDFAFRPRADEIVVADFVLSRMHFWDFKAGIPARPSVATVERPLYIAHSPDGRYYTLGHLGRLPTLFDTQTGLPKPALPGTPVHVHMLAFDPSSSLLLMSRQNGSAALWQVNEERLYASPMAHAGVTSALFTSDGHRVVTSGTDRTSRIWRMPSSPAARTFPRAETEKVIGAAISPDGRRVASLVQAFIRVGNDVAIRDRISIQDARSGERVGTELEVPATRVQFDRTGRWLLTCGKLSTVEFLDVTTGARSAAEPVRGGPPIQDAVFFPDGNRVATGSADGTVHLWDRAAGADAVPPMRHEVPVVRLVPNATGTRLFVSGAVAGDTGNGRATLWNTTTGGRVAVLDPRAPVEAAAFSPDGRWLATSGKNGLIRLWDAESGAETGTLEGHSAVIKDLAFHPEGGLLASASDDGTVRLWRVERKELVGSLRHPREVEGVAFSPDGRTLLTRSFVSGLGRLWDVGTLRQLGPPLMHFRTRAGYFQATLLFAPDGQTVLAAGESAVNLFPVPMSRGLGGERWGHRLRARTGQELDAGGGFRVLAGGEWRGTATAGN